MVDSDQVVLVEMRRASMVAGCVWRIEGQFGQEAFARGIAGRDLFELKQVGAPRRRVFMDAFQVRLVPEPDVFEIGRPFRRGDAQLRKHLHERRPVVRRTLRRAIARQAHRLIERARHGLDDLRCGRWTDAGQQLQDAEAGDAVARIFREPEDRKHILDVGGVEEFQAAEFHERDVAARQLDLQRTAVMRRAEEHRLLFQRGADFAFRENCLAGIVGLRGFVADTDELRALGGLALRPQNSW